MIRILCYGDSNTWGYVSGSDHLRYDEKTRWTRLLQNYLGNEYEIIEEGLNSRTLKSEDKRVGREGRNGLAYLKPCLDSQDKVDVVVFMLGTNELKAFYNNSSKDMLSMFLEHMKLLREYKSQIDKKSPSVIVLGIAKVAENSATLSENYKYSGVMQKRTEYNSFIKKYCLQSNIEYIDNDELEVGIDGVHITEESHRLLANKVAKSIRFYKI